MKNKILLSIGLLLSFAGAKAMSNQEYLELMDNLPASHIIVAYLAQAQMLPSDVATNVDNFYVIDCVDLVNKTLKFKFINKLNGNVRIVDVTALIPQIQNLSNNQE